jgi:AraC-like DNA-binding protein
MIVTFGDGGLDLPATDLCRLVGQRLPGDDGVGKVVSGYLQTLASVCGSLQPPDAMRLSSVAVDLLSVMLGGRLGALSKLTPERRDRERFIQIQRFIIANLADAELTPDMVARAYHISLRTLHRLFQVHATTTVSGWIRERRLEGYRAELLDPSLRDRSVHELAFRWGFTNASHASRAFKSVFGLSPAAYRAYHATMAR